jgi:hypothetical protein
MLASLSSSPPFHATFPLIQAELAVSASSSDNASLPLPPLPTMLHSVASPQAETEALNLHQHRRPPFPDRPTPTLHFYRNVISILATLPTTQPRLHFASSLARALCHQSSTRCHRSLLPPSHVHRPSAQRHPW